MGFPPLSVGWRAAATYHEYGAIPLEIDPGAGKEPAVWTRSPLMHHSAINYTK